MVDLTEDTSDAEPSPRKETIHPSSITKSIATAPTTAVSATNAAVTSQATASGFFNSASVAAQSDHAEATAAVESSPAGDSGIDKAHQTAAEQAGENNEATANRPIKESFAKRLPGESPEQLGHLSRTWSAWLTAGFSSWAISGISNSFQLYDAILSFCASVAICLPFSAFRFKSKWMGPRKI